MRDPSEEEVELWRAAVESARLAICVTTPELDPPGPAIVYCNDAYCELVGRPRGDVLGRTPRLAHGPLTDRAVLARLHSELGAGRSFEGETVNYRAGGEPFMMQLRIEPVRRGDRLCAFVGWSRDVTAQRRGESALAATVAIDTALHDTLRRPSTPRRDFARIAEVGEQALRGVVGGLGAVQLHLQATLATEPTGIVPNGIVPSGTAQPSPDGGGSVLRRPILSARGRFSGAVRIVALDDSHRSFIDLAGVDTVCLRLGSALDAVAELGDLRSTALRLQECHLPPPPAPNRRFEAVSRYQPSAHSALIGGDWFDVLDTPRGPVFVIGDVMCHDLAAAADMGRVRTAMAVLIGQDMELPTVLSEANAFCTRQQILATALLARLGDGTLEVVSAGHPPPLLARPDGGCVAVGVDPAPPLGVGEVPAAPREVAVGDGDVLLLYTDGLIETRGEGIEIGLEALRSRFGGLAALPLRQVADVLVAERRDPSRADDLALLAVRVTAAAAAAG
ncbi:MAG: SpoIIE family protein phosphatase [Acidimicrobiales bacterium]|nr:SpoIIE family protein phosphatase [Acidimicrobiales bacterium]